ncbi:hypothetical protein EYF80_021527 [Liparis tanakae]|uniref:Uncharacterized protein n=1 Tax=Liparis tanakae TaxID=230148 RepID=A0A4Z2HSE3_9TELE|nr:hypothetical protein EYF80_021527 [Liparis tanakae]
MLNTIISVVKWIRACPPVHPGTSIVEEEYTGIKKKLAEKPISSGPLDLAGVPLPTNTKNCEREISFHVTIKGDDIALLGVAYTALIGSAVDEHKPTAEDGLRIPRLFVQHCVAVQEAPTRRRPMERQLPEEEALRCCSRDVRSWTVVMSLQLHSISK